MAVVTVVKEFTFDSAHFLPGYNGLCANLHGHTYRLQVGVRGQINPVTGMVLDFAEMSRVIKSSILRPLDHTVLNEVGEEGFPCSNPTAERMVVWIANVLKTTTIKNWNELYNSPQHGIYLQLDFVRLWETPTSYVEWREK